MRAAEARRHLLQQVQGALAGEELAASARVLPRQERRILVALVVASTTPTLMVAQVDLGGLLSDIQTRSH